MIKLYYYPKDSVQEVLKKSGLGFAETRQTVRNIIEDVKKRGNEALFEYTQKFDGVQLDEKSVKVSQEEIEKAYADTPPEQLAAIRRAAKNVLEYHLAHKPEDKIISSDGGETGTIIRPLEIAGIYAPGGTAPYPSSVLMCALPAKAAGVKRIIMCSPKIRNPLTLVAANECGVSEIYKVGGAQAIAAMSYGSTCVPKVDIIAGPGNIFVTLAKKEVFGDVKIDMIAGPSEILVIADKKAKADVVAADMLSQAEHDILSRAILITDDEGLALEVISQLDKQVAVLSRKDIAKKALYDNGAVIVVNSLAEAVELSNKIAPEHLELCVENFAQLLDGVTNAGAIFAGYYSPEPLGDYYAGPSHVLPTSGTARHFEVLNTATFTKKISFIHYSEQKLQSAAQDIILLAETEGFTAHANAIKIRTGEKL
ncbi:MAG: histidinol dehydrogenase [Clostridia bacterium]|nr:histidinol dehydrogenase [Clostridia bacterium]